MRNLMHPLTSAAILAACLISCSFADDVEPRKRPQSAPKPLSPVPAETVTLNEEETTLSFEIPLERLDSVFVNAQTLLYDLDFIEKSGNIALQKRSEGLVATDGRANVSATLKIGLVGHFVLKLSARDQAITYSGRSDEVTVRDGLEVKLKLAKAGGGETTTLTIELKIGDVPDWKEPSLLDERLNKLAQDLGDPKTWNPPTFAQVKATSAAFCDTCHTNDGIGKTDQEGFYKTRKVSSRLSSNLMPTPGNPRADDMDVLKKAGFDYRAAMIRFAKSLGNEN